jgi:hypothetical protein
VGALITGHAVALMPATLIQPKVLLSLQRGPC